MTAYAYYNEIDPVACAVLKEAITLKIIAPGYVDSRSIKDVHVEDLYGFEQHHFFAGAGLWSVACRLAGWPDDRPIWTASCPCQGWSVAGKGLGFDDPRDLWPDLFRLWRAYRPAVGVGEITSGSAILPWLDRTCADLEGEDYACRAVSVPACAVDTPNIRQRLWWSALADATHPQSSCAGRHAQPQSTFDGLRNDNENNRMGASRPLADPNRGGRDGRQEDAQRRSIGRDAVERPDADLEHAESERRGEGRPEHELRGWEPAAARADASIDLADTQCGGRQSDSSNRLTESSHASEAASRSFWHGAEWIACADGKARRAKPGLRMLVDGMAGRTDLWRLAGNSINPILAAEVIKALKETMPV